MQLTQSAPTKPAVLPKPAPPCHPPPAIPLEEASSPTARGLKSAMKQRKEIGTKKSQEVHLCNWYLNVFTEGIPNGVKIGDRVIWYNGRIPVPGHVKKLYKDGTDKYTALVHFVRFVNDALFCIIAFDWNLFGPLFFLGSTHDI